MYRLDDQYLRPKKAAHLRRWHEDPLEVRENLKVWQGCNATILPLRKDSRVQFGLGGLHRLLGPGRSDLAAKGIDGTLLQGFGFRLRFRFRFLFRLSASHQPLGITGDLPVATGGLDVKLSGKLCLCQPILDALMDKANGLEARIEVHHVQLSRMHLWLH